MFNNISYTVPEWEMRLNSLLTAMVDWVTTFSFFFAVVGFIVCLTIAMVFLLLTVFFIKRSIISAIFVRKIIRAQRPLHNVTRLQAARYAIVEWWHYIWNDADYAYINGVQITWPGNKRKD